MAHNGTEDCLEVESRADRLTHLTQSSQLPNRLRQLARSRLQFLKQSYILDGDHCLVSKGLQQGDLLVRKRTDFHAANRNASDNYFFSKQRHNEHSANPYAQ